MAEEYEVEKILLQWEQKGKKQYLYALTSLFVLMLWVELNGK